MEQKTNPSGEQAATQAPQPTAWIERVKPMESNNRPDWMTALADEVEAALDNSGIDTDPRAAVIFIAVHPNPDGSKHVVHEN